MAKQRKPVLRRDPATAPLLAPKPAVNAAAPAGLTEEEIQRRVGRIAVAIITSVGAIFLIYFLSVIGTGEELAWKKDLARVDGMYREGRHAEAAAGLAKFGKDWPGAAATFDWNFKMGRYHAAAGDWATAHKYYAAAQKIQPKEPGVNALAGEAAFKAGDRPTAWTFLRREIEEIGLAVGDHDRANFYYALSLIDEKRWVEAMRHIEAISDEGPWEKELAEARAKIEAAVLEPARQQARELARQDLARGPVITSTTQEESTEP